MGVFVMKNLKKFIKKVYYDETTKTWAFCEKERQIYTVKKVETVNCSFIFVSECIDTNEFLKYAVAYNDYYFAFVYSDELFVYDEIKIFENFNLKKLSYSEFLNELQEEKEMSLENLLDNGITGDEDFN